MVSGGEKANRAASLLVLIIVVVSLTGALFFGLGVGFLGQLLEWLAWS